jgi:hypothetical protein
MRIRSTLLTTIGLTLCASSAFAVPTVALTPVATPLVTRVDTANDPYGCPDRNAQTNSCIVDGTSQGVGFHDCIDDTKLQFSIQMTNVPDSNYTLQVWAGTGDCTQAGATNNGSTSICWQVAASPQMALVISPFYIRVADLVRYINVSPPPQTYTPTDAVTACNDAKNQTSGSSTSVTDDSGVTTTTAGETTVTVFFLVFAQGSAGQAPVASATYPVKVKLVGPNAVSDLAVGSGDSELIATWTPPSGDTTVQGFDLYAAPSGSLTSILDAATTTCDPSSVGTTEMDDAGNVFVDDAGNPIYFDDAGNVLGPDAGCTTSGPSTNTCSGTSGTLDISGISCRNSGDGGLVNSNGGMCTQVYGTTQNSATIMGLTNETNYAVAVAAFDQFGNAGAVSVATCSTPKPISDFWSIYNQDGGNAFCGLALVGSRGGGIAAALVGIAGMIFVRRRRKR